MSMDPFIVGVLVGSGVTILGMTAATYAIWRAFLMSIVDPHRG